MRIKRLIPSCLILALLLSWGCSKDKLERYRGPEDALVAFSVKGTKASSTVPWQVGNQIGVYTADASGKGGVNVNCDAAVKEGGIESSYTAAFSGTLGIATPIGANSLYAYYPYSVITAASSYSSVPLLLSAAQTMTGTSHDSRYEYMYANGQMTTTPNSQNFSVNAGDLNFQYVVGFVEVGVNGITAGTEVANTFALTDAVSNVSIAAMGETANPKLAGNFTLNLTTGAADFGTPDGTGNRAAANCEGMTLATLAARIIVNPFTLTGANDKLEVKITVGDYVLKKEIPANALTDAAGFAVTAGNTSAFQVTIDDTWDVEDNVPGKLQNLHLVKNNVGPHTLTIGWDESTESTLRTYVVQIFADRTGSPLFTSPTLTYKANNTLYSATTGGTGPVRFTFTELNPATTYYIRVKHSTQEDSAYSDFISGTTEAAHVPGADEVFFEGFDKVFWGSDPMNSAMGSAPLSYTGNPAGFSSLTEMLNSDANTNTNMVNYGAFSTEDFGLKHWRYSATSVYVGPGYMKLGSSSANGSLRTVAMAGDLLAAGGTDCILTFKACPFVIASAPGEAPGEIYVWVVHEEANADPTSTVEPTNITNITTYTANQGLNARDNGGKIYIGTDNRTANYQWTERRFELPGLKPTDKIWFKSAGTAYRFLLDDIKVVTLDASSTPLATPTVTFDDNSKTTSQLKATWPAVGRAVSYTVAHKKTTDASFTEVTGVTATEYLMTGLDAETEYQVKVKAVAAAGGINSEYSAVVSSTTAGVAVAKLAAPAGLAVESTGFSTATLTWNTVDGATGYAISVGGTQVGTVGAVLTYDASGLDFGTQYSFAVKALASDQQYNSDFSTGVNGTTKNVALVTKNVGTGTLCFGWEEAGGTTYTVQIFASKTGDPLITASGVTFSNHAMFSGTTPTANKSPYAFTFTELSPNTKYYMRVKLTADGDGAYSGFLEGTTRAAHVAAANEVLYQGFDKLYWGSDPMNSASGIEPGTYATDKTAQPNPAGFTSLTKVLTPQTGISTNMTALGATTNANNDYGMTGWTLESSIYTSPGYIKIGTGTGSTIAAAGITTPALGSALPAEGADCILSFKACPFVTSSGKGALVVTVVSESGVPTNVLTYPGNSGLNSNDTATEVYVGGDYRAANYQWMERTFTIPSLKSTDKVQFSSTASRYLLDDILIVKKP